MRVSFRSLTTMFNSLVGAGAQDDRCEVPKVRIPGTALRERLAFSTPHLSPHAVLPAYLLPPASVGHFLPRHLFVGRARLAVRKECRWSILGVKVGLTGDEHQEERCDVQQTARAL